MECKTDINAITIPKSIFPAKFKNQELLGELKKMVISKDVNLQQKHLKSIVNLTKNEEDRAFLANVLSFMFVKLVPKHPLRKTLTRALLSIPKKLVSTCLVSHIISSIDDCGNKNRTQIYLEKAHEVIIQLNFCFNNFPPGIEALVIVIDPVFIISAYVFLKSHFFIKVSEKKQTYLYNSSKLLVSLLSQLRVASNYISAYGSEIIQAGFNIISDESIDFNTRSNCGILLGLTVMHLPERSNENSTLTELLESCSNYTAKICIFSGIVKIFPPEALCDYIMDGIQVFVKFFLTLVQNATKVTGNPKEILEVSKTFVVLSKLFTKANKEYVKTIFKPALTYIWTHLDHFIDTVRHDTIAAFKNFVKISVNNRKTGYQYCMKLMIDDMVDMLSNDSINYKTLSILATETSCEYLMDNIHGLPQTLLMCLKTSSVPQQVCSTYEYLMEMYAREQPEKWIEVWVKNLVKAISDEDSSHLQFHQKIFTTAAKIDETIIELLAQLKDNLNNYNILLVFSSTFITIRKVNPNVDSSQLGLYFWRVIFKVIMYHQSDEVRILVPSLLIDCHKSTEVYPELHLKYLITFLHYNIVMPSPSFRQQMIALYKKGLIRHKDSLYVIKRNINSIQKKLSHVKDEKLQSQLELALKQEKYYKSFINEIVERNLKMGLLTDVNYYRRSSCLELLRFLKQCIGEAEFNKFFKDRSILLLYEALIDTYESNINMAIKLLLDLPPSIAFFQTDKELLSQIIKSISMAKSIKLNNTISAAYLLRVSKNAPNAPKILKDILHDDRIQTADPILLLVNILINEIKAGIEIAKKNIHKASKSAPVYGLLFCIRYLVEEEHFELLYPNIVPAIIDLYFELSTIVSPIVNSSSPEGYLPQNHGQVIDETATSQMILVYAWRTSKEISLLLGELNIVSKTGAEIISLEYLKKIEHYFMNLFMETKHRGAYEQAYVGFSKFCSKLWQTDKSGWTIRWMDTILEVLDGKNSNFHKICSTRRSAGVPFVIQAILTTENSSRDHKSLHTCMEKLLSIAEDNSAENIKAATHSMNILRALYKNSLLGELVATYISRGVIIAINGFNNVIWGIRNASTLLFAALMTRMFGVQRSKDTENVNIKNRLAAKVFFMRYPELYNFMLKRFADLISFDDNCLYPLLLILSRLYSSNESSFYKEYCPHVLRCLGSSIYKIRELAAQSFISIVPTNLYENIILTTFHLISDRDTINLLHGKLLKLKAVLKNCSGRNLKINLDLLTKTHWILDKNNQKFSHIVSCVYMEIVFTILSKSYELNEDALRSLISIMGKFETNTLKEFPASSDYEIGKVRIYLDLIANRTATSLESKSNAIKDIIFTVLTCNNEKLQLFAANSLKYIFLGKWRNFFKYEEEEFSEQEFTLVKSFDKVLINNLIYNFTKDERYIDLLKSLMVNLKLRNITFTLKMCLLLPYFGEVYNQMQIACYNVTKQEILDFLINLCCKSDSEAVVAILPVINMFVKTYQSTLNYEMLVAKLLVYFSEHERGEEERLNVAYFLVENHNFLYDEKILKVELIIQIWYIVLNLLQDDDEDVRNCMSKISNSLLTLTGEKRLEVVNVIPEKSFEELLHCMPKLLNQKEALNIYLKLSLQYINCKGDTETQEVFDKGSSNSYQESLVNSSLARKYLKENLWKLEYSLSYKDKTIFLEEHVLLVATKLHQLFSTYLVENTNSRDVLMAMAVLREIMNYLEVQPIGKKNFKKELLKFVNEKILTTFSQKTNAILTMTTLEYVFNFD